MDTNEHFDTIDQVRDEALICCRCDLCYGRRNVVFGAGPAPARLMIVGEGPGADEDEQGIPFVGRAGKLLDGLLRDAGIRREETWITNVVRCRPTVKSEGSVRNRPPRITEVRACDIWMSQELRFALPDLLVCLGAVPAQALIDRTFRIAQERGRWQEGTNGIPAIATYHPAYALRLAGEDRRVIESQMLEDLRMVSARMSEMRQAA
jgi:uracil-DNA glycosylase family protein